MGGPGHDTEAGRRSGTRIVTAELLSIGTELVVGETRDTNAAELAASLTTAGVAVGRITALPDRLETVSEAYAAGLARADLVVSTGGLGPTPDDLTREAIARVCGDTPVVDPELEAWLRGLWARRGIPFPEMNRKQAWLIPSAQALPNPNGTAPGWFVEVPSGGVIVALPGPPREMRPMWRDEVLPRLQARGLGADVAMRTFRLYRIGESQVAEILGEELLRRENPEVATYARAEAVDVRVSAVGEGRDSAEALVEDASAIVVERLGEHIWATGDTTWSMAIGARLTELGWRLAVAEIATRGQMVAVLGDVDWLLRDEIRASETEDPEDETGQDGMGRAAMGQAPTGSGEPGRDPAVVDGPAARLLAAARDVREAAGAEVGLAVRARSRGSDTSVTVAVVTPTGEHIERHMAFLGGSNGRTRAALIGASVLLTTLRTEAPAGPG